MGIESEIDGVKVSVRGREKEKGREIERKRKTDREWREREGEREERRERVEGRRRKEGRERGKKGELEKVSGKIVGVACDAILPIPSPTRSLPVVAFLSNELQ